MIAKNFRLLLGMDDNKKNNWLLPINQGLKNIPFFRLIDSFRFIIIE